MFTLFLPKVKDENLTNRLLNKMLKKYSEWTGHENAIISSPGFLSTGANSTIDFLSSLAGLLTDNKCNTEVGLLNGMNGAYFVRSITGLTNRNNHINNFPSNHFQEISLDANKEIDHRKMMCFFTRKEPFPKEPFPKEIKKANLDNFLNTISVNAILLGSSNQSNKTYFNLIADKGEADIFLFRETYWSPKNKHEESLPALTPDSYSNFFAEFENSVLLKSVYGKGDSDPESFLKDILKDVLSAGLN